MRQALAAITILALGLLACGQGQSRQLSLYPSPTVESSPVPLIVQVTTTPNATQTPNVVVITATADALGVFCVSASAAVHLRPSPNDENYPIMVIPNGTEVNDLGGRSGDWIFVELGDEQGWVHGDYVGSCP